MLITERKFWIFTFLTIYFADKPLTTKLPNHDFITYHSYKKWKEHDGYEENKYLISLIDLNQNIDTIWKRMSRQHKRHINRSIKNGTIVTVSNDFEKFHEIYENFLRQKNFLGPMGINVLPLSYMRKYATLIVAENQGEMVAANIYLHDHRYALLLESVYPVIENTVENKKRSTDANCSILWEAMKYFKKMDLVSLDIGELSCENINSDPLASGGDYFKRCFGGEFVPRFKYRKFNAPLGNYHYIRDTFSEL